MKNLIMVLFITLLFRGYNLQLYDAGVVRNNIRTKHGIACEAATAYEDGKLHVEVIGTFTETQRTTIRNYISGYGFFFAGTR